MTKTRKAILNLLSDKSMSFKEIYIALKIKDIVRGTGFNRWNLAKSLKGLTDNQYIYSVISDEEKIYCLAIDGKIYLKKVKIMEDL